MSHTSQLSPVMVQSPRTPIPPVRSPALQSRDPRTNTSRFETDALRQFLLDTPPPVEKTNASPEDKVPKKESKRKALLRIMRRRPSEPGLASPVANTSHMEPLPAGSIQRTISGNPVIMIGPNGGSSYQSAESQTHLPDLQPSGSISHSSLPHTVTKSRPFSTAGTAIHPLPSAKTPLSHGSEADKRPHLLKSMSDLQYRSEGVYGARKLGQIYTQVAAGQSEPDYLPTKRTLNEDDSPITASHSTTIVPIHVTVQSPSPPLSSDQDPNSYPLTPEANSTFPAEVAPCPAVAQFGESHEDDRILAAEPEFEVSKHPRVMVEVAIQADPANASDVPQSNEETTASETTSVPVRPREPLRLDTSMAREDSVPLSPSQSSPIVGISPKKRQRKPKLQSSISSLPISESGKSVESAEVSKLDEVQDKSRAFKYLFEMYKGQKSLREEGERLYQLRIADLTAALTSQKMINQKLSDLLVEKGLSLQEITTHLEETVGPAHLRKEQSSDIANAGVESKLDTSRFLMLRKEAQLSRMREFSSTQTSLEIIPAPVDNQPPLASATNLVELAKMPALRPPLTPAPSMPLPAPPSSTSVPATAPMPSPAPIPDLKPSPRRAIKSMVVSGSDAATWSVSRSRSLTEHVTTAVPSMEAIEQNMRRLEMDFETSTSRSTTAVFQTAKSGLNLYLSEFGVGSRERVASSESSPLGISVPPAVPETVETAESIEQSEELDDETAETTPDHKSAVAASECSVDNGRHRGYYMDSVMSSPSLVFRPDDSNGTTASVSSSDAGLHSIVDPPSHPATPPSELSTSHESQGLGVRNTRVRIVSMPPPRRINRHSAYEAAGEGRPGKGADVDVDYDGNFPPFGMDESKWNDLLLNFMSSRRSDSKSSRRRSRTSGKWRPRSAVELRDYFISEEIEQP